MYEYGEVFCTVYVPAKEQPVPCLMHFTKLNDFLSIYHKLKKETLKQFAFSGRHGSRTLWHTKLERYREG